MLNCQQVTRLYSESQERALTLQERMSLKVHVMMCSGCRNFGKQMHTLRHIAHTYAKRPDQRRDQSDE
ncbi:MAG: zf-HC2 domain-containing protein [Glaciimonas sp.]|nr:zf-HC2 domain-containing protein [Glaciimonas sp.]